jgi:hypothetical protein
MRSPERENRGARWRRLLPLLWLSLPILAAVGPWAWQRWRAAPRLPHPPPALRLTGETRRDRQAILERAAEALLPGGSTGSLEAATPGQVALMGEIGVELLALDRPKGRAVVQQALMMAERQSEGASPPELMAPERRGTRALLRLARTLKGTEPDLAEAALRSTYERAQGNDHPPFRVYTLCLFAGEAADIDRKRARAALQQAHSALLLLPRDAPADLAAVVAATTARIEGPGAAQPLVEQAVKAVPAGRARPLVQARLASRLAKAAPGRALQLARAAAAGIQIEPQRRAVAALLAATHPEIASKVAGTIREPGERLAALLEMAAAAEARAPARAAALYRKALSEAQALPEDAGRAQAVLAAATGLAAWDLRAARTAVEVLAAPLSAGELMRLGARAAERQPEAAREWISRVRQGDPSLSMATGMDEELLLALVRLERETHRALAIAQQLRTAERWAAALLAVARRLGKRKAGA